MRVKSEARRHAIAVVAWEVFREKGFERASMSEISDRVGGSKATLYSYFKSKDELFAAALEASVRERARQAFDFLEGPGTLHQRLTGFARAYLDVRLSSDTCEADRAIIAEAKRSSVGELIRNKIILPHWRRLADIMAREMAAGRLREADAYFAAIHLHRLVEADLIERRLHGDMDITRDEEEAAIAAGVDVFLRAYAS